MKRRAASSPQALNQELIEARIKYDRTCDSVINRALDRVDTIREVQKDLAAEEAALQGVVNSAK